MRHGPAGNCDKTSTNASRVSALSAEPSTSLHAIERDAIACASPVQLLVHEARSCAGFPVAVHEVTTTGVDRPVAGVDEVSIELRWYQEAL